jgi:iron complex outermembrane receptor protein
LQDVPIAVTVVSSQALKENNVATSTDLQALVPSFTSQPSSISRSATSFYIRGQGLGTNGGAPAVITYLNEVPIVGDPNGASAGGPGFFFDLDNIQVLKGPQGTLFGRNSLGGAVLLQSARPTSGLGGYINAGIGNYNDREADGAINLPLVSDKLLTRVAFSTQHRDGFTHVVSTPGHPNGIDLDDRDYWSVRGTIRFRPTDWLSNDLIVTDTRYHTNGSASFLVGAAPVGGTDAIQQLIFDQLAEQQALGPRRHVATSVDYPGANSSWFAIQNITNVSLTDGIKFKNIIGYQKAKFDYSGSDYDGTAAKFFDIPYFVYRNNEFTEEPQLFGTSLGGKLIWQIGGFFLTQEPPHNQPPPAKDNLALTTVDLTDLCGPGCLFNSFSAERQDSRALFGQATFTVAPGLNLTGGLRYTWDKRHAFTDIDGQSSRYKGHALTYTLSADYHVSRDTMVYLSNRRGYRTGGALFASDGTLYPFKPEYLTETEGGLKSVWSIGSAKLTTDAAVFYDLYTDIQVDRAFLDSNGVPQDRTDNAARARLWGGELEANLQLSPNFSIGGYYSHLDFKYTKFYPGTNVAALLASRGNGRVPNTFSINSRIKLPVPSDLGGLELSGDFFWRDRQINAQGVGPVIPSYGKLNMALTWTNVLRKGFDVMAFMSNVTNKTYIVGGERLPWLER